VYLLDTDHLVILQRGPWDLSQSLLTRMRGHAADAFFVSIVTFQEQLAGWLAYLAKKRPPEQIVHAYQQPSRLLEDYSQAQLAAFSDEAARRFDELRKQRVRIGTMDLRIASIALVGDHTVLTRNVVDFEKVPGLRVEDWTGPVPDKPR
jgi:tRNA(fMet)-specific endonuclease VapC